MKWLSLPAKPFNSEFEQLAMAHQAQLTKPPGSLGRMEQIATHLAGLQGMLNPSVDTIMIRVFAADHGIAEEGVSAFPQAVTGEMVKNFSEGGAAITVLAESLSADFGVINLGTVNALPELAKVSDYRIAAGTQNFCRHAAMSTQQLNNALSIGQEIAIDAMEKGIQLFIGGEMGIGNTTSASALACALLNKPAAALVGKGTGLDDAGIQRKRDVVIRAMALHGFRSGDAENTDALECLRCLGGFEIVGLVGVYIACAQAGVTILVDGFISSVAALVAVKINPTIRPWLFFSHHSAETGHEHVLAALNAKPLLSFNMRLGEASGAAMAAPLMQMACRLHKQMATFEAAGVSDSLE